MKGFSLFSKILKEGRVPVLQLLKENIKNFFDLPLKKELKTVLFEGKVLEVTVPVVDKGSKEGKLSKVYLYKR